MTDPSRTTNERERLEIAAVEWIVRLTSGEATAEDRKAAESWQQTSPAHRQAFEKANRLWLGMEALQNTAQSLCKSGEIHPTSSPLRKKSSPAKRFPPRKKRMPAGPIAATLAALSLLYILYSDPNQVIRRLTVDYSTGTGKQITQPLSDGSVVHLNTQAALNIAYFDNLRHVELLTGEAAFQVAKDPLRPFIVDTHMGTIRAIGTEFIVHKNHDSIRVTVIDGIVEVSPAPNLHASASPWHLTAGQHITFGSALGISSVTSVDLRIATAWRRGNLIFEAAPLIQVVEEINRYRPGYIIVLTDSLRDHRVNGVFHLDRLDTAVATIERTLPITALHITDRLIFLR